MACHAISSKTSCVSHPATLPNLFLDRSLGRVKVPRLLRAAGLHLVTLAEHYGMPHDQSVKDVDRLKMAGVNGYVVFMKDEAIQNQCARTCRRPAVLGPLLLRDASRPQRSRDGSTLHRQSGRHHPSL